MGNGRCQPDRPGRTWERRSSVGYRRSCPITNCVTYEPTVPGCLKKGICKINQFLLCRPLEHLGANEFRLLCREEEKPFTGLLQVLASPAGLHNTGTRVRIRAKQQMADFVGNRQTQGLG